MMISERVINVIKKISECKEVKLSDNLQNDVCLDSLGLVTLLIEIEEEFSIELDESDMNPLDLITVQSVVDVVERYCDCYE